MLEMYFKDPECLASHRAGLLGAYIDSFVERAGAAGYPREGVRRQCWIIRDFGLWLERSGVEIGELDDSLIGSYLDERGRGGLVGGSGRATLRFLVEHLKALGVALAEPAPASSPLERFLGGYSEYLKVQRGLAATTVDYYLTYARRFLGERFGEDGPLAFRDLQASDVSDFVLRWAHSQSPGRAKLMVTALRALHRFLLERGQIEVDLAGAVPTVPDWRLSSVPKYLPREQVERLLSNGVHDTATGRRDRAILLLLARLGLRAGEVVALELDDIDWRAGEINVRGKGSLHDRLPLLADVGEALAAYLSQDRPSCTTRRIFVRARAPIRGFAGSAAISTIVSKALRRAGLNPATKGPHLLRHSLATGMLRSGASMPEIGQVLRHRHPNTTEIYAKVDFASLRRLAQPWPVARGER